MGSGIMKSYLVRLPLGLHNRFKVVCASEGVTMREAYVRVVRGVVENFEARERKRGKRKTRKGK